MFMRWLFSSLFCSIMVRNDAIDDYLATLGMWRKTTAKDESSLFRAVAEQVRITLMSQSKTCILCQNWHNKYLMSCSKVKSVHYYFWIVMFTWSGEWGGGGGGGGGGRMTLDITIGH